MMRSSQQLAALLVHQKPGQKRARGKNQYRHRRQVHSFEVKPNEQKNKQILYCSVLLDAIWNKYQNNLCTPWELAHTGHGWHGWNGTHRGFRCVFGVDSAAHVEGILLQRAGPKVLETNIQYSHILYLQKLIDFYCSSSGILFFIISGTDIVINIGSSGWTSPWIRSGREKNLSRFPLHDLGQDVPSNSGKTCLFRFNLV